jgi:FkbM family methyltransferase
MRGARHLHRTGAWIFDRSGPFAPALAALGDPLHRWMFPKSLLADPRVPIEVDGLRLYHEGHPSYHMQMLAMGMHDRDVARLLRDVVRPRTSIVDVGAHLGYFTLLSARISGPGGTVWAFEPAPNLLPILRRNVAENDVGAEIHVVAAAVGDAVGVVPLLAGAGDSMLSSVGVGAAANEGLRRWDVPCTALDAWAAENGWPTVDLVKIDIEGYEVAALKGMKELCDRSPGLVLIIEFNEHALAASGETASSFWAGLDRCGLNAVAVAGVPPTSVRFPRDLDVIRREVRRQGNGRVNLVCSRAL